MTNEELAETLTESIDALAKHVEKRLASSDSKFQAFNHVISSLTKRMEDVEGYAKDRAARISAHDVALTEHDYRLRAVEENIKLLESIKADMHDGFQMLARLMQK